ASLLLGGVFRGLRWIGDWLLLTSELRENAATLLAAPSCAGPNTAVLRCSNRWNIFPPMRIGALVALLCVAACRTRSLARMAQQSDSAESSRPEPQDPTHSSLLGPP